MDTISDTAKTCPKSAPTAERTISAQYASPEALECPQNALTALGPASWTLNMERSARSVAVDTDDPYHTDVRRQTDGDDALPVTSRNLPEADPSFTGAEVKKAFKAFHPRKVPGIDGFSSDICYGTIFRDLG
ncbi:hypothetical protein EVAR_20131_1 [Eumeta japonica]|uniref:Uncharacterized protein n=1 Tax=Eumeta variegata TaxID=151549 RepID=A0A4C1V2C8_EUMVA|nr:hypothetical protein EVAR_20131_1 [Eumeta japonica]